MFKKDFELVGQLKRSAISSMANIAESVSHFYVALDQNYIGEKEMDEINQQADFLWKKINNFIAYLNRKTV